MQVVDYFDHRCDFITPQHTGTELTHPYGNPASGTIEEMMMFEC